MEESVTRLAIWVHGLKVLLTGAMESFVREDDMKGACFASSVSGYSY